MTYFPHQRNRLQPSEALLDAFPFLLTDRIAAVPRGSPIDRAAAAPFDYGEKEETVSGRRGGVCGNPPFVSPEARRPAGVARLHSRRGGTNKSWLNGANYN